MKLSLCKVAATLLLLSAVSPVASAQSSGDGLDYPTFAFLLTDQSVCKFHSEGLTMTVDGADLTLTHRLGATALPLGSIVRMYFSTETLGVGTVADDMTGPVEVFTLAGERMGGFADTPSALRLLGRGVYIFKYGDRSVKINIE